MVQHKLTIMRKKETSTREFRGLLKEIGMLMGYEVTRDFPLSTIEIETPIQKMFAPTLAGKKVVVVPIHKMPEESYLAKRPTIKEKDSTLVQEVEKEEKELKA